MEEPTAKKYTKVYEAQLDASAKEIVEEIMDKMASDTTYILSCYECLKDGEFSCHRRHFARWLRRKAGLVIQEFPSKYYPPQLPPPSQ